MKYKVKGLKNHLFFLKLLYDYLGNGEEYYLEHAKQTVALLNSSDNAKL